MFFLELLNNTINDFMIDMMSGVIIIDGHTNTNKNNDVKTTGFKYQSCMSCASLKHPLTSKHDANCSTI